MTIIKKRPLAARSLALAAFTLSSPNLLACSTQTREKPESADEQAEEPAAWPPEQSESDVVERPMIEDASLDSASVVSVDKSGEELDGGVADAAEVGSACRDSAERFQAIVLANCAACHGQHSQGAGGFFSVQDSDALIASGKVVPNDPEASPLFRKVSSGAMPPAARSQRPSADDIEALRTWIECGAPRPTREPCKSDCSMFVDIRARLELLVNDLKTLDTPEKRLDVRYLDLSHYANAGHGEAQLDQYRDGLSFLVNSLSRGPKVVAPLAIDRQALLFRIRLSDYGWTPESWEQLVAEYPYAVDYDADSRSFPIDDTQQTRLREQTGTRVAYVQADWFFSRASRPPLYYTLLGVPRSVAELQAQLELDIAANIASANVARSGFKESGPSNFNRVIERHSLGEGRGALWLTYDFDSGAGLSNVITHPLDFRQTSSEILFSLPNGLHGFMSADARGARLDKAPNGSVQDPRSVDLAIESGISCLNCHTQAGVIPKADEVRAAASVTSTSVAGTNEILARYPGNEALNALFEQDAARYRAALTATRIRAFENGSTHQLDGAFTALMSAKDVAGVLGIEEAQLLAGMAKLPGLFPRELLSLRTPGAKVPRDLFDSLFPALVVALDLGTPGAQQAR